MKFGSIFTLALAMFSSSLMAASLTFDNNIELSVINGKAHKESTGFFQTADSIALPNGDQQVVFRIFDNFRSGKEQTLFRSEYYLMTFADQGDKTIKIAAAPLPNFASAQRFDTNPQFTLTDGAGQPVPFKLVQLKKEGMQVTRDLVEELAEFNATGHEAAIASRAPFAALVMANTGATAIPTAATPTQVAAGAGNALLSDQMLRYWFQQADQATRTRFLEWAQRTAKTSSR